MFVLIFKLCSTLCPSHTNFSCKVLLVFGIVVYGSSFRVLGIFCKHLYMSDLFLCSKCLNQIRDFPQLLNIYDKWTLKLDLSIDDFILKMLLLKKAVILDEIVIKKLFFFIKIECFFDSNKKKESFIMFSFSFKTWSIWWFFFGIKYFFLSD